MARKRKYLFFLLVLVPAFAVMSFSMQSCDGFGGDCWPGDLSPAYTDLHFYKENQIQFTEDSVAGTAMYAIEPGGDMVFEYFHANDACKSVMDDEFSEVVFFQIPAGTANFQYCDSDLQAINCIYDVYALFFGEPYYPVVEGCIKGTQLDADTWHIDMDLTVQIMLDDTGEHHVYVSDEFDVSDEY